MGDRNAAGSSFRRRLVIQTRDRPSNYRIYIVPLRDIIYIHICFSDWKRYHMLGGWTCASCYSSLTRHRIATIPDIPVTMRGYYCYRTCSRVTVCLFSLTRRIREHRLLYSSPELTAIVSPPVLPPRVFRPIQDSVIASEQR